MIKVLIVEDSLVGREFLIYILTSDPGIQVVGVAFNGKEAVEAVKQKRPDIITMDIHMPVMDGFEATRRIMETEPTPIVIVSESTGAGESASTFRALEAGALAIVRRPPSGNRTQFEEAAQDLIQTVKLMSEIKVVRRFSRLAEGRRAAPLLPAAPPRPQGRILAAAIGASTGGPPVLLEILSGLPRDLPFPVLIVQHIAAGFVKGLVEWLGGASRFPVHLAGHGESPLPGHAYVAPDGFHMGLESGPRIVLSSLLPENGLRPSVAFLFRSAARILGPAAAGVLLTGMGRDGAEELRAMKDQGAITIVQDEESSVVFGMPGEAIRLGAAGHILPPQGIAALLASWARQANGRQS